MPYIDFHCDMTYHYREKSLTTKTFYQNDSAVDLDRMQRGACLAQFFSFYFPPEETLPEGDTAYFHKLYWGLRRQLELHTDHISLTENYPTYLQNRNDGKISAFLTLEDGRILRHRHESLDFLHFLGIRLITLTWNRSNCLGHPHSVDPTAMARGLTPFGREVVEHMNALGILIDVSHLSDGGFWDVAAITRKPFIASHSASRTLCPHTRNLTDDMIRHLGETGGLIGIPYVPQFLSPDPLHPRSTVSLVCDHLLHIYRVGGLECVALGSDWDGFDAETELIDPLSLPLLWDELHRRGLPVSAIEKIAWGNGERLLKECL